jgi:hypothetical protein
MNDDELRKLWKAYSQARGKGQRLPFPDALRDLTCGAKTRKGTPCKQKGLYGSGRCKLHGGLSTGPTTPEGKSKSSLNWKKRKIFMKEKRSP